eukprot:CAMPEP_0168298132 /NCGR_PEP_ID=MMETSP0142_2-20121227/21646_1 /TAXON_ID=44445 /ORGANISM="Pseudo-nitzschia australis, Strain 10249 10 AB" /LENGTH=52 /DNA_ID=CAMNT_0008247471 /DNA_START=31 /DNA_END=189 /DNA_ORIENTATION=-
MPAASETHHRITADPTNRQITPTNIMPAASSLITADETNTRICENPGITMDV